jgi:hypothetical protein
MVVATCFLICRYFNKPTGSVKGIFAVALTDKQRSGHDILVKTDEGSIKTYLQLQGTVPRPATVRLETRNNKIRANFPTHVEDQVVHFAARSAHGRPSISCWVGMYEGCLLILVLPFPFMTAGDITIALARGFRGLIVIETFAGGINRTKDVKNSCNKIKDKHIPSAPFCMDTYYVCPQGFTSKDIDTEKLESLDVCKVKTYQGNINVAYIDELNVTDANVDEVGERCTIS